MTQIYADMESKPAYRNPRGLIRIIDHPCLWFYPDRICEICGKNQGLGFDCGSAAPVKSVLLYLKMMFSCMHLVLRVFQDVQNPDFLQKVTKETKSHNYRPGPSFPSLPSVKSAGMGLVAAMPRQVIRDQNMIP